MRGGRQAGQLRNACANAGPDVHIDGRRIVLGIPDLEKQHISGNSGGWLALQKLGPFDRLQTGHSRQHGDFEILRDFRLGGRFWRRRRIGFGMRQDYKSDGAVALIIARVADGEVFAHRVKLHLLVRYARRLEKLGDAFDPRLGQRLVIIVRSNKAGRSLHPDMAAIRRQQRQRLVAQKHLVLGLEHAARHVVEIKIVEQGFQHAMRGIFAVCLGLAGSGCAKHGVSPVLAVGISTGFRVDDGFHGTKTLGSRNQCGSNLPAFCSTGFNSLVK